jgi:serine/threonine-protein kinase RsbT
VPIAGEADIVAARQRARDVARALGFGMVDQSRIATAVSELSRNVVRYATGGRGEVVIRVLPAEAGGPGGPGGAGRAGVEVVVRDAGPGIPDVEQAMRAGFTSGNGMGMGLPGTRRLMDEMTVESGAGRGTTVTVRKWRR